MPRLLERGHEVLGWDLDSYRIEPWLLHPNFHFQKSDYSDPAAIQKIASCPVVIHLAALCNPSLYNTEDERVIQSNFTLPAKLAEACAASGSWLLYFSTSEVYGRTVRATAQEQGILEAKTDAPSSSDRPFEAAESLVEDESPLLLGTVQTRRWSYACAKQLMERYLMALGYSQKLQWTVVRPFNFLGPRMDFIPGVDGEGIPRVMACFMDALLHGKPLQLVDGGSARRAFTWIGDAVDGVESILKHRDASIGQCFNIGNPSNEVSIQALAERMIRIYLELHPNCTTLPETSVVSGGQFYGAGYQDSDRRMPSIAKARRLLGWNPHTDLETTLRQTMEWYVGHY